MKAATVLSLIIFSSGSYAAEAASIDSSNFAEIDVVSVAPRSPDVKPYVMAIFTKEQLQRVAVAGLLKVTPALAGLRR